MYLCDCMSNLRFTRYIYMYFPNSRFQSQVGDVTQSHEHSKHWGIRIVFTLFGESLISSANKHLETSLVSTWQSASGSFPASHQYVILIDYPKKLLGWSAWLNGLLSLRCVTSYSHIWYAPKTYYIFPKGPSQVNIGYFPNYSTVPSVLPINLCYEKQLRHFGNVNGFNIQIVREL